jgi:phospholipase C
VTYDEEGGFFDHLVPPTPPRSRAYGLSTVSTENEIFPGDSGHASGPYGLGIRVPMIVVSPWSRGGWVNSQLFDHTSLIRFLEARFAEDHPGLIETNITPWRRAIAGDLTTAFDFRKPEAWKQVVLPSTDAFKPDLERHPDEVPVPPVDQQLPQQERGVRPARAIPYSLDVRGEAGEQGAFALTFINTGAAAAVFHVRSGNAADLPSTYTVSARRHLTDQWHVTATGYDLSVYGPNGFARTFKGGTTAERAVLAIFAEYREAAQTVDVAVRNDGSRTATVRIDNRYTGSRVTHVLAPGESIERNWSVARFYGWYDLTITVDEDPGFERRLAGHLETGHDSVSDPAMGGLVA